MAEAENKPGNIQLHCHQRSIPVSILNAEVLEYVAGQHTEPQVGELCYMPAFQEDAKMERAKVLDCVYILLRSFTATSRLGQPADTQQQVPKWSAFNSSSSEVPHKAPLAIY